MISGYCGKIILMLTHMRGVVRKVRGKIFMKTLYGVWDWINIGLGYINIGTGYGKM